MSPHIPDPVAPPVLPAIDELRNLNAVRSGSIRGATLLTSGGKKRDNPGSLATSIDGGIMGGVSAGGGSLA